LTRVEVDGASWIPSPWTDYFNAQIGDGHGVERSGTLPSVRPLQVSWMRSPADACNYVTDDMYNNDWGTYSTTPAELSIGSVLVTASLIDPGPSNAARFGGGSSASTIRDPNCRPHDVDCATGNQFENQTDFAVPGSGWASGLTRTYNSQAALGETSPGQFGYGWSASYSDRLAIDTTAGTATVTQANGSTVPFTISGTSFVPLPWVKPRSWRTRGGTYTYTLPNQNSMLFDSSGRLVSESDRFGEATTMTTTVG